MDDLQMIWVLIVPALAGLLTFLCPRRAAWLVNLITVLTTGWLLFACSSLLKHLGQNWQWNWMELAGINLSIDLFATHFGVIVALLIALFGFLLALYCVAFTPQNQNRDLSKHHSYILWTLAAALGAALTDNLIFMLICWEITTLMLYLLINLGGSSARAGAAKTFAILGLSDCAMLLAILLFMFVLPGGSASMSSMKIAITSPFSLQGVCYLLLLVAALAKAGAMPFHTWIPAAAEGAPCDVMAFLPASLDKLLGIYLLARISLQFFVLTNSLKVLLMVIGAVTIVGAVMMAMVQHDLKKLLSFHAISQVGYMVLGIGTGSLIGIAGAVFHMVNHAMYKSCLFLVAGSVQKQTGTTELDKLGGLAKVMPLSFFACVVSALAISGVPPLNGFTSKWLVYQAVLEIPSRLAPFLVLAAVFGSALTLASFIKVIHSVFLGSQPDSVTIKQPSESSQWMTTPMLVLAAACILFGIFPAWPLENMVGPAFDTMKIAGMDQVIENLWNPALASFLLLVALAIGVLIYVFGRGFNFRRANLYIGGEKITPEAAHYSGTGFYSTVRSLPGIKSVYKDAERDSYDIYHIGGRIGGSIVQVLRNCQTGVLSLYLSWLVLGLVIILICLIGLGQPN
ncbi:MAG: hypothetical protein JXD22_05815 [Sedimentisphaerales bacterium]|nr:hypothetical protein [Sedimentisphaerales bacterium]